MPIDMGGPRFDAALQALAKRQRRLVLTSLLDTERLRLGDVTMRTSDPQQTLLLHSDLPKLTELGYINWNEATEEITRGPNFEDIEPLLRLIVDHQDELPSDWL